MFIRGVRSCNLVPDVARHSVNVVVGLGGVVGQLPPPVALGPVLVEIKAFHILDVQGTWSILAKSTEHAKHVGVLSKRADGSMVAEPEVGVRGFGVIVAPVMVLCSVLESQGLTILRGREQLFEQCLIEVDIVSYPSVIASRSCEAVDLELDGVVANISRSMRALGCSLRVGLSTI